MLGTVENAILSNLKIASDDDMALDESMIT